MQEGTNVLEHPVAGHRVNLLPSSKIATYIKSPMFLVSSQDRDGYGALVSFSFSDDAWYLGVISSHVVANHLLPSHHTHDGYISIFCWKDGSTTI